MSTIQERVAEFHRAALGPAYGLISSGERPDVSPRDGTVVFTGVRIDADAALPTSRICATTADGGVTVLTAGPGNDHTPRFSPDGATLAFLSDRATPGRPQLHLLRAGDFAEAVAAPQVDGTVESLAWSRDGGRLLLGVAALGADVAGALGSGTLATQASDAPSWMPVVETSQPQEIGRSLWSYSLDTGELTRVSRTGLNVWESCWAGATSALAVTSDGPSEDTWYSSVLSLIDFASGEERLLHRSDVQLGVPAASPSGARLAVLQAVCSDRTLVAGDLLLVDAATGAVTAADVGDLDVTHLVWRDEDRLTYFGVRGLEMVVGEYDAVLGKSVELWSERASTAGKYPNGVPYADGGAVVVLSSYDRPPAVAVVGSEGARVLASLAHPGTDFLRARGGRLQEVRWTAPDGLELQGLLIAPDRPGPHPLVVNIHGGPIYAWQDRWSMGTLLTPLLVDAGFAVFLPNPRGSGGRGQEFAARVVGDMGGVDTHDYLSGIDHLVETGVADPDRLAVYGISYGGFMTSWLITQDSRFAAAVSASPSTNWLSMHYTCNIPAFCSFCLDDEPDNVGGRYYTRSPLLFAKNVRTPTLNVAGALDRCTPPTQAVEFHRALVANGVESELVIYPEEGHGVRSLIAQVDYHARVVDWLLRHTGQA
jgi:dipeptidyl aminopeptidase/acylaminoacyl peptidase